MKLTKLNQLIDDNQTVKGHWELTPNHEVQYKSNGKNEEIKFKGSLIAAEPDALVLSVTERQSDQKIVTSTLKLIGTWKANPQNQLVFEVEREQGKKDSLTFKASWKVNNQNEIVYTYEEQESRSKSKTTQELIFQGYWGISEENRLTYFLGADSNSAFRFRGAFQTKSILAKRGEIRYQIGIELQGKPVLQEITLFGKWKLSRDLELSFEVEYEDNKKAIIFGGEYHLDDQRQIAVSLKSQDGKPLGVEVIFTKDFFDKDGQAFVRFQKSIEESRIEVGGRIKW